MLTNRYYNVKGTRWEARFFRKGEPFPDMAHPAPRQGVWARPASSGWDQALFLAPSWNAVQLDPDVLYLPERKP
ncbi:MAG: hypothetical protein FJ118_05125 [Deltaproteobacteria bacterium]|nr:hypothetical protein [Deltaproteobacteria bacterium]